MINNEIYLRNAKIRERAMLADVAANLAANGINDLDDLFALFD